MNDLKFNLFAELHLTVVCFDSIYPAVQLGGCMNIVVMLMQFYLHRNRQ
ncbi:MULTISPECIES: hypothetical protein [unclassified Ruminococcus]|nr:MULTISPECIES: hypothetical protein [unclassified Ruminococcus]MCQ4022442.1 hypothetical protein [Ruminococcus sp. zg-924]MCQ4114770.1 hypothetical protein [Ruminococcus sp. zg-921]